MTITNLSTWWAQAVQAVQARCLRYCSGSLTVLGAKDRCFPTCNDSYLSQSKWPRHMWHRILIASLSEHASKLHKHVTHSCNSARGSVNLRMAAFHFQPTGLLGCQKAAVFTRMWYQSALRSWRGAILSLLFAAQVAYQPATIYRRHLESSASPGACWCWDMLEAWTSKPSWMRGKTSCYLKTKVKPNISNMAIHPHYRKWLVKMIAEQHEHWLHVWPNATEANNKKPERIDLSCSLIGSGFTNSINSTHITILKQTLQEVLHAFWEIRWGIDTHGTTALQPGSQWQWKPVTNAARKTRNHSHWKWVA